MNEMIITGYQLLTVVGPGILAMILLKRRSNSYYIGELIFAIYIFGVFYMTGVSTIYDLFRLGIDIRAEQVNLIPLAGSIHNIQYILNVILFVPLGFLLPLLWPKISKWRYIIGSGFVLSLLVEISQLFNLRATDVDDLMMNTIGALVGYLCFKIVRLVAKKPDNGAQGKWYEPWIVIAVMFMGRFLLFNEMGMARLLYGF